MRGQVADLSQTQALKLQVSNEGGEVLDPLLTPNQQRWPGMKTLHSEPTPQKIVLRDPPHLAFLTLLSCTTTDELCTLNFRHH